MLTRALCSAVVLASTLTLASEQEPNSVVLKNGVIVTTLREGDGPQPSAADSVKVHYRGTFPNGTEFDSSYKREKPAVFPLTAVIRCWTDGVQKMKVGGKAKLVCPPETAYGKTARPQIPANSTLVFEVELLEVLPGKSLR
jgi:FKBP-type peptidyl-prolyl cis-trans isomerase FkpA